MTFPLPALTSKRTITGLESTPKLPTRSNALFRAVSQFFSGLRICSMHLSAYCSDSYSPQQLCPMRSQPLQQYFFFNIRMLHPLSRIYSAPLNATPRYAFLLSVLQSYPILLKSLSYMAACYSRSPSLRLNGNWLAHRHASDGQRGAGTTGDRAGQGLTGKKDLGVVAGIAANHHT